MLPDEECAHRRRHLVEDISARLHALKMRKCAKPGGDAWNVAYWAGEMLRDRIPRQIDALGGLMGEW